MPEGNELEQTELFIGLVAAIGTDVGMVAELLAEELEEYGYTAAILRLSDYLADSETAEDFRELPFDERVWKAMDAGDELRRESDRNDVLALRAISDMVAIREEESPTVIEAGAESYPGELPRHAFILRSAKTRAEVHTLRAVYGSRFYLVAAYSPDDKRPEHLAKQIEQSRGTADRSKWSRSPEELIARDHSEEEAGGQEVGRTFHLADFFIRADGPDAAKTDIERTMEILFGHPFRTPTRDEFGQFQAAGAALRSAEMGRQVGAAVATPEGSVISLGTNEVPKAGGGSHWEGDPDGNREFELFDEETNQRHQKEIARKIAEGLSRPGDQEPEDEAVGDLERALLDSGLGDITEFGRAVHAEMDALLDAARRGISVLDCTLHTTTFPCHNCARHIVAAGISRLTFIEPYPKSKARDLHDDSISIAQSDPGSRVDFQPFIGVAPRRYLQLFDASSRERRGHLARKGGDGKRAEFSKSTAHPVFADLQPETLRPLLPAYRTREIVALRHFALLSEPGDEEKASKQGEE